ncbi:RICIN domain-containing protein [Nonomuraea typhae]|uniref:RICIN domain-containing protein n=1 Tax=Nonomuraea typhae TaxID=2603600 RepID=A0ABW7Z406_9ACTN
MLLGLLVPAAPARAAEPPAPGVPCTGDDLSRRHPWVESAVSVPEVTHFKGYFVTTGSNVDQQVTLMEQTVITVAVMNNVQVTANFDFSALFKAQALVQHQVTKTTATTKMFQEVITWRFTQPGFYGVFKGTRRVTGTMSTLNCGLVSQTDGTRRLEWMVRPGGSFTTFGPLNEGAVRCEDVVPERSVMKEAQRMLGCFGAPAAPKRETTAPAEKAAEPATSAVQAFPPGFVCEPGYGKKFIAKNGMALSVFDKIAQLREFGGHSKQRWRLCTGPDTDGFPEVMLQVNIDNRCLEIGGADPGAEGKIVAATTSCNGGTNQRFILYRDVPGSTLVGIQSRYTGSMLGPDALNSHEPLRQYKAGVEQGLGTFSLEPL